MIQCHDKITLQHQKHIPVNRKIGQKRKEMKRENERKKERRKKELDENKNYYKLYSAMLVWPRKEQWIRLI